MYRGGLAPQNGSHEGILLGQKEKQEVENSLKRRLEEKDSGRWIEIEGNLKERILRGAKKRGLGVGKGEKK